MGTSGDGTAGRFPVKPRLDKWIAMSVLCELGKDGQKVVGWEGNQATWLLMHPHPNVSADAVATRVIPGTPEAQSCSQPQQDCLKIKRTWCVEWWKGSLVHSSVTPKLLL